MIENIHRIVAEFDRPRWRQALLPLTWIVIVETSRSCLGIPDLDCAEGELAGIRRAHGSNLLKAEILEDRPDNNGEPIERPYRLNYVVRETRKEALF